jgi:hypothetical protein
MFICERVLRFKSNLNKKARTMTFSAGPYIAQTITLL